MKKSLSFAAYVAVLLFLQTISQAAPLVTEQEAALPPAPEAPPTRGIVRGPGIKVVSPVSNAAVSGPFDLKVKFEPRSGIKIDPSTVRVIYLKSPVVDLTSRIKPAITEAGIELLKTEMPAGLHEIRILVRDSDGRESQSTINISIKKQ